MQIGQTSAIYFEVRANAEVRWKLRWSERCNGACVERDFAKMHTGDFLFLVISQNFIAIAVLLFGEV